MVVSLVAAMVRHVEKRIPRYSKCMHCGEDIYLASAWWTHVKSDRCLCKLREMHVAEPLNAEW